MRSSKIFPVTARTIAWCLALALGAPLAFGLAPAPVALELPEVVVRGIDRVRLDAQRAGVLPLEAPRLAQTPVPLDLPAEALPSPALGAPPPVRSPGCAYRNPVTGAVARATGGAEALYKTALERLSRNLLDEAAGYLAQLRADHPGHPRADDAAFWLAEVRRRQGKPDEAVAFLRLVRGTYALDAVHRLAWLLSELGRDEEARQAWEALARDRLNPHRPEALYRLGADRLSAGEPRAALPFLEELQALREQDQPVPPEVRAGGLLALGLSRQGLGDHRGAEAALVHFVLESPDHPSAPAARVALAWALLEQGKAREAEQRFAWIVDSRPPADLLDRALYGRVRALVEAQDPRATEALLALEAGAPSGPWVGWARADLAWLAFRSERYEEALSRYRSALRVWDAPGEAVPRYMTGESLFQLTRYEEASEAYRSVGPETALGPAALHRAGLCELLAGRPAKAAPLLEEALRRDPSYPEADRVWAWLGEARLRLGLRAEALQAFHAVPERSTAHPQALLGRAWLAFEGERWDEAAELFARFLRAYPADANRDEARLNLARAHFNRRELRPALDALDRLEAEAAEAVYRHAARYYRGWMHVRSAREDEGRAILTRLLADAPEGPFAARAHQTLGWLSFAAGDFATALARFEAALALEPESDLATEASQKRADSLYNLGRYAEALDAYRLLGDTPEGNYGQALCLVRLGRLDDLHAAAEGFAARHGDDPRSADLFLLLARAQVEAGDPSAAAVAYGRAAELSRGGDRAAESRLEAARTHLRAGQTEQALDLLIPLSQDPGALGVAALRDLALHFDDRGPPHRARGAWDALARRATGEDQCRALRSAAHSSRALLDWAGAEERLSAALEACPAPAELLRQGVLADLGEVFLLAGNPDRAIAPLSEASAMGSSPEGLRAFLTLGRAQEAAGRAQEALETYLRIGYLYPLTDDGVARALLRAGRLFEDQGAPDRARGLYERISADGRGEAAREARELLKRPLPGPRDH